MLHLLWDSRECSIFFYQNLYGPRYFILFYQDLYDHYIFQYISNYLTIFMKKIFKLRSSYNTLCGFPLLKIFKVSPPSMLPCITAKINKPIFNSFNYQIVTRLFSVGEFSVSFIWKLVQAVRIWSQLWSRLFLCYRSALKSPLSLLSTDLHLAGFFNYQMVTRLFNGHSDFLSWGLPSWKLVQVVWIWSQLWSRLFLCYPSIFILQELATILQLKPRR